MDKLLETVMNFINENTTLLIIICVFLIIVLIGYLIDNSIKTKRLEKQMINDDNNDIDESVPIEEPVKIEEEVPEEPVKEEVPSIDPNMEINLDFRTEEEKERDNNKEESIANEITVDPAINDLLLKDFSNNGIKAVDEEENDEVTFNPIENVSSIEEKEEPSKDIPDLPDFSAIEEKPIIKEEPVKEESIYKNDKKLSDIFKKKTVSEEPKLEKTEDYSNELDKILKKLNEASSTKDSTLEETTDFTNMF